MNGNHTYLKNPDQTIDLSINWWPYLSRATTSDTQPHSIRVRVRGWAKDKQGIPTFYPESIESIDPLPQGMSKREHHMILVAVTQELAQTINVRVMCHKDTAIEDASEWYAEHGRI